MCSTRSFLPPGWLGRTYIRCAQQGLDLDADCPSICEYTNAASQITPVPVAVEPRTSRNDPPAQALRRKMSSRSSLEKPRCARSCGRSGSAQSIFRGIYQRFDFIAAFIEPRLSISTSEVSMAAPNKLQKAKSRRGGTAPHRIYKACRWKGWAKLTTGANGINMHQLCINKGRNKTRATLEPAAEMLLTLLDVLHDAIHAKLRHEMNTLEPREGATLRIILSRCMT